ncbi:NAD(P)/FAD-dependent oxidoreductase [Photobacterium satsumensis]|uniref:NAD(P)/FAD-dependent oxidoreductase n=1 Tax=Photobacterium satsumensis TaxID=2910239 RepID=UPI003D139F33
MEDIIVIGCGVVGASIAYGLLKKGIPVTMIDEGTSGFKASKGNFGLVWCQGKGFNNKEYSRITFQSCQDWEGFSQQLEADSGLPVDYENKGGLYFLFDEKSHLDRIQRLQSIKEASEGKITYQMLDHQELKQAYPALGSEVYSASYCKHDGTCDPLKLVYALQAAVIKLGGKIVTGKVNNIISAGGLTKVTTTNISLSASKVVIAAGLGNSDLSKCVGIDTPLKAIKGQIIVSQRLPECLPIPSLQVRQTSEGTVICGDSHEDVGLNTSTTTDIMQKISKRAIKILPSLANKNVNRVWGALRVMTPDTIPIYEQSEQVKGVFNVSCHSGVTLAAFHTNELASHIINGELPDNLSAFSGGRF